MKEVFKLIAMVIGAAVAIIVLPIALLLLIGIVTLSWQLFVALLIIFAPIILIGVWIGYMCKK